MRTSEGKPVVAPPDYAMYSYDCMNVLAQAIRQLGVDADLSKALEQVSARGANGDERGLQRAQPRRRHRRRRVPRAVRGHDVQAGQGRSAVVHASGDPANAVNRPAAIVGLLLAAALPAVANASPILLPSVRTPLSPGPPLIGSTTAIAESLVPQGTTSAEEVRVGVDATGKPVSVVVLQRLKLSKLGDYTFAVPGPVAGVEAAPGSDSDPGLRQDAIVWAGFSPGHKTLAARVTTRVKPAAPLLPLRLTLTRTSDALVVRGENAIRRVRPGARRAGAGPRCGGGARRDAAQPPPGRRRAGSVRRRPEDAWLAETSRSPHRSRCAATSPESASHTGSATVTRSRSR